MKKRMIKGILALSICVGLSNSITALACDKVHVDDGPIRCFVDEKEEAASEKVEEKKEDNDKKANTLENGENKKETKETDVKQEENDKSKKTNTEEKNIKEENTEKKTKKLDSKETTIEMIEEMEKASAPCKRYSVGDFWTEENEKLLTEEQKSKIKEFREKNEKGENLSLEEVEILKEFRISVIKTKLGEEKFKEYEKLMEKRDGDKELTLEERAKLYEFNKEIMGKK